MEPVRINLVTATYLDRRLSFLVVLLSLCVVFAFSAFNFVSYRDRRLEASRYREMIDRIVGEDPVSRAHPSFKHTVSKEALEKVRKEKRSVNRLILLDRFPWPELLDRLEKAVPPGVRLGSVSHSDDFTNLALTGRAENSKVMGTFIGNLGRGGLIEKKELSELTFNPSGKGGGIGFSLTGRLNMGGFPRGELYRGFMKSVSMGNDDGK